MLEAYKYGKTSLWAIDTGVARMKKETKTSKAAEDSVWLSVVGRALAYQCLNSSEIKDKTLGERAGFLTALGLPREDVAAMLNTTVESVRVQLSKKKKKKKHKRSKDAKGKK